MTVYIATVPAERRNVRELATYADGKLIRTCILDVGFLGFLSPPFFLLYIPCTYTYMYILYVYTYHEPVTFTGSCVIMYAYIHILVIIIL